MNIAEFTETEVHEMSDGSDKPDVERMSTQDYLEALLHKNGIPRTKKSKPVQDTKSTKALVESKQITPKTPPADHEEPTAPTQQPSALHPAMKRLNTPLAQSLAIEAQTSVEAFASGRDSAISIMTTKAVVLNPTISNAATSTSAKQNTAQHMKESTK